MMALKRGIEFDFTGSDGLPSELCVPLRRAAFQVRRHNGMPRAVMLSLCVHASIAAALCFQLVPQQFIRASGSGAEQKFLEVVLISGPAGAAGEAQQQVKAAAPAPAAVPEPVVQAEKKPEPVKKKPAAESLRRSREPQPAAAREPAEETPAGTADAAAEGRQQAVATDAPGPGGQTGAGSGSGSGAPYDTSFGQADAPRFLNYVQPRYPLAARQQGKEGTVVLRLIVDEKGTLVRVEVISSPSDAFADSAVEAVKRSSFAPAQRNGRAIIARAMLAVRFALRH